MGKEHAYRLLNLEKHITLLPKIPANTGLKQETLVEGTMVFMVPPRDYAASSKRTDNILHHIHQRNIYLQKKHKDKK